MGFQSNDGVVVPGPGPPTRGVSAQYRLCALIIHSGNSIDGGHYFAYVLHPSHRRLTDSASRPSCGWLEKNDATVTAVQSFRDIAADLFIQQNVVQVVTVQLEFMLALQQVRWPVVF